MKSTLLSIPTRKMTPLSPGETTDTAMAIFISLGRQMAEILLSPSAKSTRKSQRKISIGHRLYRIMNRLARGICISGGGMPAPMAAISIIMVIVSRVRFCISLFPQELRLILRISYITISTRRWIARFPQLAIIISGMTPNIRAVMNH